MIAMQALARFSEDTYSSQLNKTIAFDIQGLTAAPVTITDNNRFERNEFEVLLIFKSYVDIIMVRIKDEFGLNIEVNTFFLTILISTPPLISMCRFRVYQATQTV